MRDGIRRCTAYVKDELHGARAHATLTALEAALDDDACGFGNMPPVPRRKIVQGKQRNAGSMA